MPYMNGEHLNMPFRPDLYLLFNSQIDKEHKALVKIAEQYIKEAADQGDDFKMQIR